MCTIWLHLLKRLQDAHRTGRFTRGSPFFGVFSNCHTWTVTDDHPPPPSPPPPPRPPYNFTQQSFASALGPSLTENPTIRCNTRAGDLSAAEKPERWAIRGSPRHPTGDFMQGKTDKRAGETPWRSGRPFLKEERPLCRQGDWVSLQLVAWC